MNKVAKVLSPIASLLGGDAPKAPEAPPPPPAPAVMPEADDERLKKARRKKTAEVMQRSGRLSTILTDTGTSDKLGA